MPPMRLVHVEGERRRVGRGARRVGRQPGDRARVDLASATTQRMSAFVRDVVEHRCARVRARAPRRAAVDHAVEVQRHDRDVAHLARPHERLDRRRRRRRARVAELASVAVAHAHRQLRPVARHASRRGHGGHRPLVGPLVLGRRRRRQGASLRARRARDRRPRASPRRRALLLREERARQSRAAARAPLGNRASRAGASAFITIVLELRRERRATYVLGGSTTPLRTMSSSASPPSPPWSGRPARISQRITPSA